MMRHVSNLPPSPDSDREVLVLGEPPADGAPPDTTEIDVTHENDDGDGEEPSAAVPWGAKVKDQRVAFETACQQAEYIAREHGTTAYALERAAELLEDWPKYIPGGQLHSTQWYEALAEDDEFDQQLPYTVIPSQRNIVGAMDVLRELRSGCSEEFGALRKCPIEVRWFTRIRKQRGNLLTGTAKVVRLIDRDCYDGSAPEAPLFVVELSLAYWLIATPEQRRAAMHNALMYCGVKTNKSGGLVPYKRQPDVVGFVATMARFGAQTKEQAQAAVSVQAHPSTGDRLEAWDITRTGQLEMFAPYTSRALDEATKTL